MRHISYRFSIKKKLKVKDTESPSLFLVWGLAEYRVHAIIIFMRRKLTMKKIAPVFKVKRGHSQGDFQVLGTGMTCALVEMSDFMRTKSSQC